MSLVSNIAPTNVNHPANQAQRHAQNQHQQPSVQNAKARLHPTQAEESVQLSGNHAAVQRLDTQAKESSPSTEQARFNSTIATRGV